MVFLNALKKGVYYWWTKIAYSAISSLTAFLNPFFIFMTATYVNFLHGGNVKNFSDDPLLFFVVLSVCNISYASFPFTLAGLNFQKKALEFEVIYILKAPKDYLISLKEVFIASFYFTLIFGFLAFLLSYSIKFYYSFITYLPLKIIMISILLWLLILLTFTQYFALPMYCYKKNDLSKTKIMKKSLIYAIRYFLPCLGISFIDFFIYILLSSIYGLSIMFYIGISLAYRLGIYNAVIDKIMKKEDGISFDNTADY